MSNIMITALKYVFNNDRRESMNERNRDTITRLKFIGTFQQGEKIDVKNLKIESNNIFTPLKRLIQGESRDYTYSFLNTTIDRSFEIVSSYSHSEKISEKLFCKNILEDMIKAIKGLQNIQKTYKDDKLFYCNIETIIENIHSKLSEIKEKSPELFKIKGILSIEDLDDNVKNQDQKEEIKQESHKKAQK